MKRPPLTPILCAVPLTVVVVCAIGAHWLAPDATEQDVLLGVVPAGTSGHLFGTDQLGRDILQLSIAGARSAVVGPVCIALGSMLIGVVLGTFAGYFGGWADLALTKYADLLLALPTTLIALVVAGLVDGGYWVTVLVLVVLFSPTDIRLVRGAVMTQAARPYIESARVLGLGRLRIMFRHILPNVLPVALATMLLNVAFALVAMSALSFLGLGVGPGEPDWGRQLSDGRDLLGRNAAAVIVPGVLIIVTAAAINLLGDWLQERSVERAGRR
ncbi:MAG: ABC transporter permease [Actinobacteria bacterium]|nr:ABC transporter permease [Actinomycetota bacterium]